MVGDLELSETIVCGGSLEGREWTQFLSFKPMAKGKFGRPELTCKRAKLKTTMGRLHLRENLTQLSIAALNSAKPDPTMICRRHLRNGESGSQMFQNNL
jgi:hypothetical protein